MCEAAIFNLWNKIKSKNEYILSSVKMLAAKVPAFAKEFSDLYLTQLKDDWKGIFN